MRKTSILPILGLLSFGSTAIAEDVFSGPRLSGTSIPVTLEREYTFEDLQKAQLVCAEKAARSLWNQVYGVEEINSNVASMAENGALVVYRRPQGSDSLVKVDSFQTGYQFGVEIKGAGDSSIHLSPRGEGTLSRLGAALELTIGSPGSDGEIDLYGAPWPSYDFELVTRDQGVDRLGRPINPEYSARVTGVRVFPEGKGQVFLENRETNPFRPSSFFIDYDDVADCYVQALQVD